VEHKEFGSLLITDCTSTINTLILALCGEIKNEIDFFFFFADLLGFLEKTGNSLSTVQLETELYQLALRYSMTKPKISLKAHTITEVMLGPEVSF
jgi:hypothetical protein